MTATPAWAAHVFDASRTDDGMAAPLVDDRLPHLSGQGRPAPQPPADARPAGKPSQPDPDQELAEQDPADESEALFPLHVAWQAELGEPAAALAELDTARVYVPLESGTLAAVSLADGSVAWRVEQPTTIAPVSSGPLLFVAAEGRVHALDTAAGAPRWEAALEDDIASPMVTRAGWVVAALASGELAALRAEDGALVWRRSYGSPAAGPPVIDGERVYLPLADGRVVAAAIASGDVIWAERLNGEVIGLLVFADRVYASSTDNHLYSLRERDGRVTWRWRTGASIVGPAEAQAEHLVFVSLDTVLRSHDRGHGAQIWRTPLPWRPHSGPRIVGETIVMSGLEPEVRGFALDTGREIGHLEFASSEVEQLMGPVLAVPPGGTTEAQLVAVSAEGRVYALARGKARRGSR